MTKIHIVVLVPPFNRLKRAYDALVEHERHLFTHALIRRVDVRPVSRNPDVVVGYGFKQIQRRRCDFEDVVVLPRHVLESPGYVDPRWLAARRTDAIPRDPMARHRRVPAPGVGGDAGTRG